MSDDSAEQTEEGAGDAAAPKKKRLAGKKIVLFIGLPLLLVGVGLGVMLGGGGEEEPAGDEQTAQAAGEDPEFDPAEADEPRDVVFYDLPEMLVNLNTSGRQASYLKLQVSLELGSEDAIPEIEALLPRIVDNFQVYLRELRPGELSGTSGVYRLKEELLVRVNTAVQPVRVYDILFKEILVQG